jgi:hypothetical protein
MHASITQITPIIVPATARPRSRSHTVSRRAFDHGGRDDGGHGRGGDGGRGDGGRGDGGRGGGGGGGGDDEKGFTDGHWSAPSDTMTVIVGATVLTRARTALTRGTFGRAAASRQRRTRR